MLVPATAAALPLTLLAAAPATSSLLAVEVPGAQPVDIFYVLGVGLVAAFGVRQVFDSAFPENTNEYRPPLATSLPGPLRNLLGDAAMSNPEAKAEQIRQELYAAAQAGDLETAYAKEKELKNLMAETGIRFIVEDEFQQSEDKEQLPDRW